MQKITLEASNDYLSALLSFTVTIQGFSTSSSEW